MSLTAEVYEQYYQHGLPEGEALEMHWSAYRYNLDLAALGVSNPSLTDRDVAQVCLPYMQRSRLFHHKDHPPEVGNVQPNEPLQARLAGTPYENWPRAAAVMRLAADDHDIDYKNVDATPSGQNAWPRQLIRMINGVADWWPKYAQGERLFEVFLTPKGRDKKEILTRQAASLFGLTPTGRLDHKHGSNECGSAIAGVQFLKKHAMEDKERPIEELDVIAIAAIIAATVPFQQNAHLDSHGVLREGYMERLGRRVHRVLGQIGYDSATAYKITNAITAMGVCVANRDAKQFMRQGGAPDMINGARLLRAEEVVVDGKHIFREPATTMSGLLRGARLMYSAPGLYRKIMQGELPADRVPTCVVPFDDQGNLMGLEHSYPPPEAHDQATNIVQENVSISQDFFTIHQLGVAVGRMFLRLADGFDTEVPGGVNAKVWLPAMGPRGYHFEQLKRQGGRGWILYDEYAKGTAQNPVGSLTTQRSPLSALTLGGAGLAQALTLGRLVESHWKQAEAKRELDPYYDDDRVHELRVELLRAVGPRNYNTIIDVLAVAADFHDNIDRLQALDDLKVPA